MEDPIVNLGAINVISDPHRAIIIETVAKRKHVSFKDLLEVTGLSNDGLTIQLEKLQKYSLIKGELTDPKNGSYSFYTLTKLGKEFRSILHEALEKAALVQPSPMHEKFVLDSQAFLTILKKKRIEGINQIFDHCKIIFTNRDYSILKQVADEKKYDYISDFLENEKFVIISEYYEDEDGGSRIEHYLRRIKRIMADQARLIVTAIDLDASLITDNERVATIARGMGVMCGSTKAVLELKEGDYLWEKFYELSLKKSDSKNVDLQIQNNPISLLKKN